MTLMMNSIHITLNSSLLISDIFTIYAEVYCWEFRKGVLCCKCLIPWHSWCILRTDWSQTQSGPRLAGWATCWSLEVSGRGTDVPAHSRTQRYRHSHMSMQQAQVLALYSNSRPLVMPCCTSCCSYSHRCFGILGSLRIPLKGLRPWWLPHTSGIITLLDFSLDSVLESVKKE